MAQWSEPVGGPPGRPFLGYDARVTIALTLQIRRLASAEALALPCYMTPGAAGMDLHAALLEDLILEPGGIVLVPTGFEVAIPEGFEGQVRPRSGLAVKHGISLPNTPATIDSDYRGEIRVPLINLGREVFCLTRGMRIAQLVVAPVVRVTWDEVDALPATDRGGKGFGHSGV
jgi:dUTP pyrophosphatase